MLRISDPRLLQHAAKIFFSAYCLILLAGCVEKVGRLDIPAQIIPQQSSRSAVRDILGEALISSNYWRVDLFRQDDVQRAVYGFLIFIWTNRTDMSRYTLITYDVNGVTESTATGMYMHTSSIRFAPIERHDRDLYMRSGDFFLGIDRFDRHATLAVNPARRDSYLQLARAFSGCVAVIGSDSSIALDTVALDDGSPLQLPFRWLNTEFELDTDNQNHDLALAAITLNQGEHTLKVSNSGYKGEKSITFACKQGDILYVVVKGDMDWNAKSMGWDIKLSESMPDIFFGRPLLVSRDHQWLVEKEPVSVK